MCSGLDVKNQSDRQLVGVLEKKIMQLTLVKNDYLTDVIQHQDPALLLARMRWDKERKTGKQQKDGDLDGRCSEDSGIALEEDFENVQFENANDNDDDDDNDEHVLVLHGLPTSGETKKAGSDVCLLQNLLKRRVKKLFKEAGVGEAFQLLNVRHWHEGPTMKGRAPLILTFSSR